MTESNQYCKCYEKGNQPPLLTDWRKTNVCQTCGRLRIHKERMMTLIKEIEEKIQQKQNAIKIWPGDKEKHEAEIRELRRTIWVFEDLQKMREKGDDNNA